MIHGSSLVIDWPGTLFVFPTYASILASKLPNQSFPASLSFRLSKERVVLESSAPVLELINFLGSKFELEKAKK